MPGVIRSGVLLTVCFLLITGSARAQNAEGFLAQANELYKSKRYQECIASCNRALELDRNLVEAYQRRGWAYWSLKKYEKALEDFSQAVRLDPNNAKAWMARGNVCFNLERYRESVSDCTEALRLDPQFKSAYITRAISLRKLKQYTEALDDLNQALVLDPDYALALANRGQLRMDLEDLPGALADYDRALELNPRSTTSWLNRGTVKARMGDLAGAIADQSKVLELDPEDADAWSNRGLYRMQRVDLDGAKQDLRQALALRPDHPQAVRHMDKLRQRLAEAGLSIEQPRPKEGGTTSGQPPAKPSEVPLPAELPQVHFRADDPCEGAKKPAGGLPWQEPDRNRPVELPADVAAATLAPTLDYPLLTKVQYNGAVSLAKEALRFLYDPMSEEDARKFEACWAPMFDFPFPEAVDYLNRLNPLLGQLLAGREAFARTGVAFQMAMFDAAIAVESDTREAYIDSMAEADVQGQVLLSLQAGLAEIARQIEALGNPPSPLAAKCEARRRYKEALDRIGGEHTSELTGEWEGWLECIDNPAVQDWEVTGLLENTGFNWKGVACFRHFLVVEMDVPNYGKRMLCSLVQNESPQFYRNAGQASRGQAVNPSYEPPPQQVFMIQPVPMMEEGRTTYEFAWSAFGGRQWRIVLRRVGDWLEDPPPGWTAADVGRLRTMAEKVSKDPNLHWQLALRRNEIVNKLREKASVREEYLRTRQAFHQAVREYLEGVPPPERSNVDVKIVEERFWRALQGVAAEEIPTVAEKEPAPAADSQAEAVQETIAFHQAMIELIRRNLRKEEEELARETDITRKQRLAFRMIQLQSDIQAEEDLVASYQTGQIVHTRSAFEEYAHNRFIQQTQENAARVDATRRIAAAVERQVQLLPEDRRMDLRRKAREILDAKTIASGDLEKARRLAGAVHLQVEGYWQGVAAQEEVKAIDAMESEFIAQITSMAAGGIVIGLGTAACLATFGEAALITTCAPYAIGGVYGGLTGTISGGPVEGIKQTVAWSAPVGFMAVQFLEGYHQAARDPKAGIMDRLWAGAKQAGSGWLIGKGIQLGSSIFSKGALYMFGKDSLLFRPIVQPKFSVKDQFAAAKFSQDIDDAQSLINLFKEKQLSLMRAQQQYPAGSSQIQQLEKELQYLAASLNSSYHCKMLLKYHAHPSVRSYFGKLVEKSYEEMTPEMIRIMESKGYDMSNIQLKQFRNASSAGSSSMDLDLGLKEKPGQVITKNGRPVSLEEFMKDCQQALNVAYHKKTGFSAIRSELNLTTSKHTESFADKRLLKKNIDFSNIDREDVAQVGAVIEVKADKIQDDPILGEIAKMQSSCRESLKEINNMLLKRLRQQLASAPPGSPQAQQLKADIRYWEDMSNNFDKIATKEINPYKILERSRLIRQQTGGRDCYEVIRDLSRAFRR